MAARTPVAVRRGQQGRLSAPTRGRLAAATRGNANTACLGFVKAASGQAPEVVLGGFQMENRLLVLDEEQRQLGFTLFLNAVGLSCSNFNFTLAA